MSSLFCDTGSDDYDWWYDVDDEAPLATKQRRRCCSCNALISIGATARRIRRWRNATQWEDDRGFTDEVALAPWYFCETCGDLADSIEELGFSYHLDGTPLREQIAEYREEEEDFNRSRRGRNVPSP